jgi:3-dehydroquinate synthase
MRVDVKLKDRSYPVWIGHGTLPEIPSLVDAPAASKTLIVTNATVAPLYLQTLLDALAGRDAHTLVLPDGEQYKTVKYWSQILDKLVDIRATRDATLLTLGGGVIGDMGGFAAASYMRGIRYVQIPTTLLAQVDASIGGKTAINHARGKNLIGAFHQPRGVLIDTATLTTLPAREFRAGLAEAVKTACVRDSRFLQWLEAHTQAVVDRDPEALTSLIGQSVSNKAAIVAEDERESGVRALLNFGHSFAHALETLTGYERYLHGEAVAIGMCMAGTLSERRGLCGAGFKDRLYRLLKAFGLPRVLPDNLQPGEIYEAMQLDKKNLAGSARLILIEKAGKGVIDSDCTKSQILESIRACQAD